MKIKLKLDFDWMKGKYVIRVDGYPCDDAVSHPENYEDEIFTCSKHIDADFFRDINAVQRFVKTIENSSNRVIKKLTEKESENEIE